mgnify:CR=1 FL=1
MLLENRTVVVTGAAMGIGRAAALCCAEVGAQIVLADIDKSGLDETFRDIEAIGGQVTSRLVDVSNACEVEKLMTIAFEEYGRIDALINCAGILEGACIPVDELEESVWERVMDTNLKGSFLTSKYAAKIMKQQKQGVIILLSSGAGVRGGSSSVAYGTSKGGVHGMAIVLESQLASFGIRVHAVCPGGIATPMKLRNIADAAESADESVEEALIHAADHLGDPVGVGNILAFLASHKADYLRQTIFTR